MSIESFSQLIEAYRALLTLAEGQREACLADDLEGMLVLGSRREEVGRILVGFDPQSLLPSEREQVAEVIKQIIASDEGLLSLLGHRRRQVVDALEELDREARVARSYLRTILETNLLPGGILDKEVR
ncbi:MAG: flagellar protein FliT [Firmicutes bacterium]|nr:flagellar protein FliT [Bacillota bacterium]MCL5040446.1 flagellar protein FliT [Bacillota bacterium]